MSNPTWPGSLPASPLLDGYTEETGENTIVSQMDAGPPKVRRRFTSRIDSITFPMSLTVAQKAAFLTFYTTTLTDGISPFDMTHPSLGTTKTFQFAPGQKIRFTRDGDTPNWITTISLLILP